MTLWPSSSVGLKLEMYPSSFKMRAISSFNREAGISTFWCRAWSAFRTRVSMSATGSVNLIVCFSSSHPFAPHPAENPRQLNSVVRRWSLVVGRWPLTLVFANDQRRMTNDRISLPRRLRTPWNLPAQRQLPEAQAANAELAQERARPSAQLAAVMPARGKLRLRLFVVARLLKRLLDLRVFNPFCRCHSILKILRNS